MAADKPNVTCSDCPLAAIQIGQGNGRRTSIRCKSSQKATGARRLVEVWARSLSRIYLKAIFVQPFT